MELHDTDLIVRVLAGEDHHAFGELVRRHQSVVRAFLRRVTCGQHALADDLAQETFIEAHRSLAKYRGGGKFSSWLLGIAYNRFRRHCRSSRPTEAWEGDASLADAREGVATSVPDSTPAIDLHQDLAAAIARLPEDERVAIHLCYDSGLSHEEAATALGCAIGTLKSRLLRGKEKLKTYLHAWAPA